MKNQISIDFEVKDVRSDDQKRAPPIIRSHTAKSIRNKGASPALAFFKEYADYKPSKFPMPTFPAETKGILPGKSKQTAEKSDEQKSKGGEITEKLVVGGGFEVRPLTNQRRLSAGGSVRRVNPTVKKPILQPHWNVTTASPDRAMLTVDLDREISRYRASKDFTPFFQDPVPPDAMLQTGPFARKVKQVQSVEHRNRLMHHSIRAGLNDPLVFYPFLKDTNGIHPARWAVGYDKLDQVGDNSEEYAKPKVNPLKCSHEYFHAAYNITPPVGGKTNPKSASPRSKARRKARAAEAQANNNYHYQQQQQQQQHNRAETVNAKKMLQPQDTVAAVTVGAVVETEDDDLFWDEEEELDEFHHVETYRHLDSFASLQSFKSKNNNHKNDMNKSTLKSKHVTDVSNQPTKNNIINNHSNDGNRKKSTLSINTYT